jgi:hypothetical protein
VSELLLLCHQEIMQPTDMQILCGYCIFHPLKYLMKLSLSIAISKSIVSPSAMVTRTENVDCLQSVYCFSVVIKPMQAR